jgi:hypothetical protein
MSDEEKKPLREGEVLPGRVIRSRIPSPYAVGRPSIITEELIEQIATLIRAGAYAHVACGAAGIARRTYYTWLDENKCPEPIYAHFREVIQQARDEARANAEIRVRVDKPDVWLMRGPGREGVNKDGPGWSAKDAIELTGTNGGPVQVQGESASVAEPLPKLDLSKLNTNELNEFRQLLRRMLPSSDPQEPK